VFLAGKEGEELERKTNTPFAASAIYRGNSKIKVPWGAFFVSNEEALEDMKRCAEEEAKSEN